MDSGTNDVKSREFLRFGDGSRVYTRRGKRKRKANLISAAADDGDAGTSAAATEEKTEVRESKLRTLDSEEAKLAEQGREQAVSESNDSSIRDSKSNDLLIKDSKSNDSNRDVGAGDERAVESNGEELQDCESRPLDQAIPESNGSVSPSSNRDVGGDDKQVVGSNGEDLQGCENRGVVEPDGGAGCEPMVVDNQVDEPDRIVPSEPVVQDNPGQDGSVGCEPMVEDDRIDESEKPTGTEPVIQDDNVGDLDGGIECQSTVQENHVEEPMVQDNQIDEPERTSESETVIQDNHIGDSDGGIKCQSVVQENDTEEPMVQDNKTDEPPRITESKTVCQDNHVGKLDEGIESQSLVLESHVDDPDASVGCQPIVRDIHVDEPDENIGSQPMKKDNHIDKPECLPVVQDNHIDKLDVSLSHPPSMQENITEEPEPMVQDSHINEPPSEHQADIEVVKLGPIVTRLDDRVRIDLSGVRPTDEINDLREKLESELYQVRDLVKKLEANEHQLMAYDNTVDVNNFGSSGAVTGNVANSYGHQQIPRNYVIKNRALVRVNSEVGSVGHQDVSLFRPPSIMVTENHGVGEYVEKEKRTPKANQYYTNSEFLLGKDRLPTESNKKSKSNGSRRKHGGELGNGFGYNFGSEKHKNQAFRRCNALLQKLMKHHFGWVFNKPVDAYALGLHDYHDIIKHPMDLGTIKTRLSQNWYKSPREFAEDVRLVFRNAMTYNPKGQDVHTMAEQMSRIFEDRWATIESEYNPNWNIQVYDSGLPTPTSRMTAPSSFVSTPLSASLPAPQMRSFDRSESITRSADTKMKPSFPYRTPVPKKPKAKDPNKRDMTYEEKKKLSTNLQSLPSEKLDSIVQIIKKRNTALSQHDDEIEVDIDNVDAETLWELDRFVTNYKKSLSKNRKKAEIAQARAAQAALDQNPYPVVANSRKAGRSGEANYPPNNHAPPAQGEKLVDNAIRSSSSSSSSSSDSGSSSSDSDSDSSSGYGSDAGP